DAGRAHPAAGSAGSGGCVDAGRAGGRADVPADCGQAEFVRAAFLPGVAAGSAAARDRAPVAPAVAAPAAAPAGGRRAARGPATAVAARWPGVAATAAGGDRSPPRRVPAV